MRVTTGMMEPGEVGIYRPLGKVYRQSIGRSVELRIVLNTIELAQFEDNTSCSV